MLAVGHGTGGLIGTLAAAAVNALKFKDALAPGHIKASSYQGKIYAVPHDIDLSAMFYNKVLFKKAGLDPEKPPTTVKEMVDAARKINALGGGVHGFDFGGNCGGCLLFTTWPMIWASGGTVLNDDGTQSTVNNPQAAADLRALQADVRRRDRRRAVQERAGRDVDRAVLQRQGRHPARGRDHPRHHQGEQGPPGRRGADPRPGRRRVLVRGGDVLGISATSKTPRRRGTSSPGRCRTRPR